MRLRHSMARTIRKTLCLEHGRGKQDKRLANRRFRRISKDRLQVYEDDTIFPLMREVSCIYDWRDYRNTYFNSLAALKEEWWTQPGWTKWWRYKFK
jgi:hypothetical protein